MTENPSRRTFLKLPAGAAVLAAPGVLLSATSPNDTVSVACIGVGVRGSFLLQQMMKVPAVRIAAICDVSPAALKAAVEAVEASGPKPATYDDYRKMLDERKDIDAVVIATPVPTHATIAVACLQAGKHVYCEKPMGRTPEECRTLVKAAQSAKGIFQVGFQLRHDPNRHAAMDFVHRGGIGDVLFLQGYRHTRDLSARASAWYFDRTLSGDIIVEQACHILDLCVWAIDKNPLRAFGSGGINLFKERPDGRTVMDNYSVIWEFPDDIRVNFSQLYFDPPEFSGVKERVFGSKGAIDLPTATWIEREKKGPIKLDVPDAGKEASYVSLEAFIDNARNKRLPLNNAESALRSTLMAIMGRKSIYEHRVVSWEEVSA
ncbi:MAG: Gfo/Idh/MocA family oxidoreductase [Bryobacteraceae bacterium]